MMRRLMPKWSMALPVIAWWGVFFIVPLGWIVYYSLGLKPGPGGTGPVDLSTLSLDNYQSLIGGVFLSVFQITIRTAGIGTLLCALVGFPVAYALARYIEDRWKPALLFLLVLPFWISFLLRAFSWRIILAPEGFLSGALQNLGVIGGPLALLDTGTAVQLGIIYNYLPLTVLPIFVALDRIDPKLLEGSMDLGAGPIKTFFTITLPLAAPGILGGLSLTFILASGDYVVPAILGGANGLMVGNLVAIQVLAAQNLPLGAAMAILLIFMICGVILAVVLGIYLLRMILRLISGPAMSKEPVATTTAQLVGGQA